MARDNVISFAQTAWPARRRVMDAKFNDLAARCRKVAGDTLPRLLQDLFEHLDDDLYELADKSANDAVETRYFDAMRDLRKLRNGIERAFMGAVLGYYDAFWRGDAVLPDDGPGSGELSLVDDAELEEDLAVGNVISKAENRYHRELYGLNQRFAHMAGVEAIADADNPLGPALLTRAFRKSLQRWGGELPVKLVVYKLFDRHVMTYVGGLYDEINDILIAANILPKVVERARRNPVAPSVQRARDPAHAETPAPGAVEERSPQQEILNALAPLLAARRGVYGEPIAGHLPVVPTNEVFNALSELQHVVLGSAPADVQEAQQLHGAIRVNLAQQLHMGEGESASRRFGQTERDVMDVISMLFEFVLDDHNLPDPMKALLSRLQIPMLKVALLDRSFFASKNHPARRLLNNLARAAVGWVDDGERAGNSLYARIESIVQRVLADFADDVALFQELDAEFSAFLEREARGAEVAEERINQVNRGQEQLKLARREVRAALEERLHAGPLPPRPVYDLLTDGWKDVLLLALLREGKDSPAWRTGLDLADQLLWSVRPKTEPHERQEMLKAIPELLRALRDGLANISFDQHRASALFKELQACHIAALRGAAVPPAELESVLTDEPESELVAEPVSAEAATADVEPDDYDEQARNLAVGQWLEWEDEGKVVRGKLSWKSEVTGTYVFVNRKGIKIAEMTSRGLGALFRAGEVRLLDNPNLPLMDRALDAMLTTLRKQDLPSETDTLPA